MRLDQLDTHVVRGTVSRRNLLTLLTKLHTPESSRSLSITDDKARLFVLYAQSDKDHYLDRPAPSPVLVSSSAVLQIAADLVEQVADGTGMGDDFDRKVFNSVAHTLAYLRSRVDAQPVGIV